MRAMSVHKRKPSPGDLPIQTLKIKRQTNKNMHVGETVTNFDLSHKESTRKNCESCGKQRLAHEWFVFDGPKQLLKNKVLLNDNDDLI